MRRFFVFFFVNCLRLRKDLGCREKAQEYFEPGRKVTLTSQVKQDGCHIIEGLQFDYKLEYWIMLRINNDDFVST